ncbi:MAG: hypothetical protein JWP75_3036 [Frondihabitans sp.]|nr:hypothetical protein [Frondihabitans sp.]
MALFAALTASAWGNIPLTAHHILVPVYAVAALLAVALLLKPKRLGARKWWPLVGAVVAGGSALGGLIPWYVGDVENEFGVSPTWVDRIWVGAVVAGLGLVVVNIIVARVWRKVVAVIAVAGFALAGGLAINRDAGEFVTSDQALGVDSVPRLVLPSVSAQHTPPPRTNTAGDALFQVWKPPAGMPSKGTVGAVHIPGLRSHFAARDALVYLPPAALVPDPPKLPVVILLSGQPAAPANVIQSGHLPDSMNALAAAHHGLAPIVVVPDQLGPNEGNPMCIDGPLGNSATYILDDVTSWITKHLRVEKPREDWAIGGFSQGGTCSLQFATAHPDTFGAFVDVSGEQYPTLATDALAIQQGFNGSSAAYDRAKPQSIMAAHGRYSNLFGFFAVGQDDPKYAHDSAVVSRLAEGAGITVARYVVPGTGHDWTTATEGFARGIASLYPRFGLSKAGVLG